MKLLSSACAFQESLKAYKNLPFSNCSFLHLTRLSVPRRQSLKSSIPLVVIRRSLRFDGVRKSSTSTRFLLGGADPNRIGDNYLKKLRKNTCASSAFSLRLRVLQYSRSALRNVLKVHRSRSSCCRQNQSPNDQGRREFPTFSTLILQ